MNQRIKILGVFLFLSVFIHPLSAFAVLSKGDKFFPFALKAVDDRVYTVKFEDGKLCLTVTEGKTKIRKSFPAAVLLDFWATWCVPCRAAMPYMQKIYEKYQAQQGQEMGGLNLFGIALDQRGSMVVKPFYSKLKITYPMLVDPPGSPAGEGIIQTTRSMVSQYKVQEIPVVYLINSKGVISHVHIGFKKEEITALDKTIGDLILEGNK
jgi:thiol-disulfide isomerase/thioredoxin